MSFVFGAKRFVFDSFLERWIEIAKQSWIVTAYRLGAYKYLPKTNHERRSKTKSKNVRTFQAKGTDVWGKRFGLVRQKVRTCFPTWTDCRGNPWWLPPVQVRTPAGDRSSRWRGVCPWCRSWMSGWATWVCCAQSEGWGMGSMPAQDRSWKRRNFS